MNAAPPDDLMNGSDTIRPGSDFSNKPEEIASVKQHIDEHATDAADKAALNKTIFGGN